MFFDSKPFIDQLSFDGFCDLYCDKLPARNIAYGNPTMDFAPSVSDMKNVLKDSKIQHLPAKIKRNI